MKLDEVVIYIIAATYLGYLFLICKKYYFYANFRLFVISNHDFSLKLIYSMQVSPVQRILMLKRYAFYSDKS